MTKPLLILCAAYFAGLGALMFLMPMQFYEIVPGVSDTGPFNGHVFRDVGLAFLLSAAALSLGALREDFPVTLFGAGFPMLHGLFHLSHWALHGLSLGPVELFELTATIVPAALALVLALRTPKGTQPC